MIVLGIESSCDDSAAAVVKCNGDILSNVVINQNTEHKPFNGVVPEIASRMHLLNLKTAIKNAIENVGWENIDLVAATGGPGLIGGVLVGTTYAKAISFARKIPYVAVNHLVAHALTARLTHKIEYPYLLLLISGGHCQFVSVNNFNNYKILGATLDDAVGECFDKTAKMLGLEYPGGPKIEQYALLGDKNRYQLPLPMFARQGCDMSFSGLKTAVMNTLKKEKVILEDFCASFQYTIGEILSERLKNAIQMYLEINKKKTCVIAGGVAANKYLGSKLQNECRQHDFELIIPDSKLCTDNAAMIAWAGIEFYKNNLYNSLDFCPRSKWSLEQL